MKKTVWLLVETEYAGQCTGFDSQDTILAVFSSIPDVKTVAPLVGKYLSKDMGEAISQVMELVDAGCFSSDERYGLTLNEWVVR